MSERLTFTLSGRDELSRVLGAASVSAQRLRDSMEDAADGSGQAILTLTQDAEGRLRGLDGRFVAAGDAARLMALRVGEARRPMADWASVADRMRDTGDRLKSTLLTLAPAAIPMAAAIAPVTASLGAGVLAMGAFTAAIVPQVKALSEASQAQKKYEDAVAESGARSKQAIEAQADYARAVAKLPPATREAAAALGVLKDQYKSWSDSVSGDTMAPLTKSFALLGGMLPRMTGLVRATGTELDRTMTILAGLSQSPGADRFASSFERFTTGVLRRTNEGLLQLIRTSDGQMGSGLSEFMAYARAHGPVVGDTLRSIGQALTNLLVAGSDVGVGMLQVVNVLASLVAAVPSGVITTLLQLAIAMKTVQLAAAGFAAVRVAMAAFGAQIVAMNAAAAAAPGRMAALGAAFMTLSRTARLAVAGTGIGLLLIALSELGEFGESAAPPVDKLTTSLLELGRTGQVTGTVASSFGKDFDKLRSQIDKVIDPSVAESINNWGAKISGGFFEAGDATKDFSKSIDSIDTSLADLVSSGKADQAKAALDAMLAGMSPEQAAKLKGGLDDYRNALANLKAEQALAAQAMGLFGAQAQATQAKLAAQKQSADGLRQAYHDLNTAVLEARGGLRGMEAAIDAAAEALKQNGVTLDVNTAKGRANQEALDGIAASTMKAVEAAVANNASWERVNAIYERGRGQLIRNADAMGLNIDQARRLAAQLLSTPNKTALLKGDITNLQNKISDARKRLASVPDSRKAQVRAEISQLEAQLYRAQRLLAGVDGKTATTYVQTVYTAVRRGGGDSRTAKNAYETSRASGGLVRGPGTTTSDSIPAWLSDTEYVIKASSVARYGVGFLDAVNDGTLPVGGGAAMGVGVASMPSSGRAAGAGLSAGLVASAGGVEASARRMAAAVEAGVRAELQIASPSKKTQALGKATGQGLIVGLTGTVAGIKAAGTKISKEIAAAMEGSSLKESLLLMRVARDNRRLQELAAQRDRIRARLAEMRKYAGEVTTGARQSAELGQLGLQPEEVTAEGIHTGLQQKLAKVKQFTAYIQMLAKKGLSKSLLKQVLAMGPEQGYAYASALAGMDQKSLMQLSSTQRQIEDATTSLGTAGGNAMYSAGRAVGAGLAAGIAGSQQQIEAEMLRIAKGLQATIKRALGIKSPSRVMAEVGHQATAGLAVGLVEQLPALDGALGVVAGRMAETRPALGRPAVAGGVGGSGLQQVRIDVRVSGSTDPVAVARELRRQLVSLRRTHGLNIDLGVA